MLSFGLAIAARTVGVFVGVIFVVLAFMPKFMALIIVSLRLLRHYASSVRHSQYHDTDVITVRVESAHP